MIVPDKKFIIGNWKMNPATLGEVQSLARNITAQSSPLVEIVICPPSIFLAPLATLLGKVVSYGVQNIASENTPALTGELSGSQVSSMDVQYVIVGHSSRRSHGETNTEVHKKIHVCLTYNLVPVVCVGETTRDTEGRYLKELETQLRETFVGLNKSQFEEIIIAYEPVWAIGTSAVREATPAEFQESMIFIKKVINDMTGNSPVGKITVVYGGSVSTPEQLTAFIHAGAQGVLLGRASIDPDMFNSLCVTAHTL